jgi:hypothetical protein
MNGKIVTSAERGLSLLLLVSFAPVIGQQRDPIRFTGVFNN